MAYVESAVQEMRLMDDNVMKIKLYNNMVLLLHIKDMRKINIKKDIRMIFVYENQWLINILPPQQYTFNAIVAGITEMNELNDDLLYDRVKINNAYQYVKRYEVMFIEGSPNKRVYTRDCHLEIKTYYSFTCVIDDADRHYWYRVVDYKPLNIYIIPMQSI